MEIKFSDTHNPSCDRPSSALEIEGKFSLTMAYHAITKNNRTVVNMDWLWKGNISPKIKIFLWLVWWDRLPTNKLLHHRNIIQSPLCPSCHSFEESSKHVLNECTYARGVWEKLPLTSQSHDRVEEWLVSNLQEKIMFRGLPMNYLFPFICWELWIQRNKFVFENSPLPSPELTIDKAHKNAMAHYRAIPNPLSQREPEIQHLNTPITHGLS